jgi:DNA-binding NarL/FixJ family response regulator
VLDAVAHGLSDPEIGRALHIGEATVQSHLLKGFEKLHVGDRTAAGRAIALGIVAAPRLYPTAASTASGA